MTTISVQSIAQYAMFEQDGIRLREAIINTLKNEKIVELDFDGVEYFTTMFFNASIGWLVLFKGPSYVKDRILFKNLSELGEQTWQHSFDNAIKIRNDDDYKDAVQNYDEEGNEGE